MLKIVLDTNMFLSAFLYHGMSKMIFDLVLHKKIELCVSDNLKTEVIKKIKEHLGDEQALEEASFFLDTRGTFINPSIKVTVCRDPEDNFVLELAETAHADYIITRDKDLLDLPNQIWKGAKIVKPETFLPFLRKMKLL